MSSPLSPLPSPIRLLLASALLSVAGATLLAPLARAELQWYGDPTKGTAVFDNLNFEGAERHSKGSGTITPATDPLHGPIWRVHKPAADKRAEIRGAKGWSFHGGKGGVMQPDVVYYLGWRYKFTLSQITGKGSACFQWKSYPDEKNPASFTQNYPFTMGYDGRELSLTTHGENWQKNRSTVVKVWSRPVKPDTWVDIVLAVKPSLDKKVGYVEIYFNGELQTLLTGGTRAYEKTLDGLEVAPKWGYYNSASVGTDVIVDLADLRIGTDLASVTPPRRTPKP